MHGVVHEGTSNTSLGTRKLTCLQERSTDIMLHTTFQTRDPTPSRKQCRSRNRTKRLRFVDIDTELGTWTRQTTCGLKLSKT